MHRLSEAVPSDHHPWDTRGPWRFVPLARQLYATYRRYVPIWGLPALRRLHANGVPTFLQRPLEFLLSEELTPQDTSVINRIESLRAALIRRGAEKVRYYASQSSTDNSGKSRSPGRLEERLAGPISWGRIATLASIPPYWGAFLYLCAKFHGSRTILELGGCAGISGCYLASSPFCERFITIEGSPDLAAVAASNLAQISRHATVITASFDDAINDLLPLADKLDCVFIDGHHEGSARLGYVNRVTPFMSPGSLMIWDDIHFSQDLWDAWLTFSRGAGAAYAVNLGRFGLVVWDMNTTSHRYSDFSGYAGYWGKGGPRRGGKWPF